MSRPGNDSTCNLYSACLPSASRAKWRDKLTAQRADRGRCRVSRSNLTQDAYVSPATLRVNEHFRRAPSRQVSSNFFRFQFLCNQFTTTHEHTTSAFQLNQLIATSRKAARRSRRSTGGGKMLAHVNKHHLGFMEQTGQNEAKRRRRQNSGDSSRFHPPIAALANYRISDPEDDLRRVYDLYALVFHVSPYVFPSNC